jgi:hypothetical protein
MDGNTVSALVLAFVSAIVGAGYFVHRLFEHVEIMAGKRVAPPPKGNGHAQDPA